MSASEFCIVGYALRVRAGLCPLLLRQPEVLSMKHYQIVYFWQGERLVTASSYSLDDAQTVVHEFWQAGFAGAFVERIR